MKRILKAFISEYKKNPKEGRWVLKALMIGLPAACLAVGSLYLKKILGMDYHGIKWWKKKTLDKLSDIV